MENVVSFWDRPIGTALRWSLFVPAGIAANVVVYFLANVFFNFGAWLNGERGHTPWIMIITMAAAGAANVTAAGYVAPRRGRRTAVVVVTTLYCLMCVVAAFVSLGQRNWAEVLGAAASAIAAVVAASSMHDEFR